LLIGLSPAPVLVLEQGEVGGNLALGGRVVSRRPNRADKAPNEFA
jgi:hypothetical protein